MRRRGFTLGELVTTLGIVAILVLLVGPGVSRARTRGSQAQEAQCLSNLLALDLAWLMYAEEWDQHTAPGQIVKDGKVLNTWAGLLAPYARDTHVFECPRYRTSQTYESSGRPQGYGLNTFVWGGVDLEVLAQPGEFINMGDDTSGVMDWGCGGGYSVPSDRHDGGANLAFADGHVKWFPVEEVSFRDKGTHPDPPGRDYWRPKLVETATH